MHPQIFSAVVMRKSVDMRRFAHTQLWVAAAGVIAVTGCAPQFQTQIDRAARRRSRARRARGRRSWPRSRCRRATARRCCATWWRCRGPCSSTTRSRARARSVRGRLGETFESYRTRRLAELERERQAGGEPDRRAGRRGGAAGAGGRRRHRPGRIGDGDGADRSGRGRRGGGARVAARRQPAAGRHGRRASCAARWSWARRRPAGAR